jgi:uncharacterized protein involved in exopolysaccharide biosynthesis
MAILEGETLEASDAPDGPLPAALRDPLGCLRRRWPWMVVALLAGLAATAVFVFRKSPRYVASATVVVTSQRIPEEFVRPTVEEDALARVDTLLGEVLSRDALANLVSKHELYLDLQGSLPSEELLARVRADIEVSEEEANVRSRSRSEAARLLRISFVAHRPDVAAAVANEVADLMTAGSIRIRTRQARLTTVFLRRELERAEPELRELDRRIAEFKERYRGELPAEFAANVAKLERLQQERQSLALQIAETETRLASLSSATVSSGEDAPPEVRIVQLRGELAEALGVMTERNPEVLRLRRQIEQLEVEIGRVEGEDAQASGPSLVVSSRRTVDELRSQLAVTEAEIRALDDRVSRTPAREEALGALEERQTVLRENYLEFLRKVQEAELAEDLEEAQQGAHFAVVDRAMPPSKPTGDRGKTLAAGVTLSLALFVGVGILLEIVDPVIVTVAQLELEGLPVLGSAPHIL